MGRRREEAEPEHKPAQLQCPRGLAVRSPGGHQALLAKLLALILKTTLCR